MINTYTNQEDATAAIYAMAALARLTANRHYADDVNLSTAEGRKHKAIYLAACALSDACELDISDDDDFTIGCDALENGITFSDDLVVMIKNAIPSMSTPTKITIGDTFKGTTFEEHSGDGEEGNFIITVTAVYPDRVVRVSDHQDGWFEQIGAIDCTLKQFGFSDSHYNYEIAVSYGIEQILDNDLYEDGLSILKYNLANQ